MTLQPEEYVTGSTNQLGTTFTAVASPEVPELPLSKNLVVEPVSTAGDLLRQQRQVSGRSSMSVDASSERPSSGVDVGIVRGGAGARWNDGNGTSGYVAVKGNGKVRVGVEVKF